MRDLAVDPKVEDPWMSIYSREWVARERSLEYGDSVEVVKLTVAPAAETPPSSLQDGIKDFEMACISEIKALREIHDYLEGISGSLMTPTLQQLMGKAQNARNTFLKIKGRMDVQSSAPVHYEIRQQVKTAAKKWLEIVQKGEFERPLFIEYERLAREYPNEYFEIVRVSAEEACLAFTPKFD